MNRPVPQRVLESSARWLARHPRGLVAVALIYLVMPIDFFPEALLGPVGYLDDIILLLVPYILREYVRRLDAERQDDEPYIDTTAD